MKTITTPINVDAVNPFIVVGCAVDYDPTCYDCTERALFFVYTYIRNSSYKLIYNWSQDINFVVALKEVCLIFG